MRTGTQADPAPSGETPVAGRPLLAGKLGPPESTTDVVDRPRLRRALDEGLGRGVVVLSAPPGSGKTLLISSWAAAASAPVAWLTLDEGDTDPARFFLYAVAALQRAAPSRTSAHLAQLAPLPPLAEVDDHYLAAVANALADLDEPLVLVLDDFHAVAGSETERLVERLLRHRPAMLGVVVATRIDPDIGMHRLRLAGRLTEVRALDLAFSAEEARDLLAASGVGLEDRDLGRLLEATEGWAAALRLATVRLRGAADASAFIEEFGGEDRYVGDYLLNEVLRRQPEHVARFLLDTCVVDRICGDLANALTGSDDGALMLADLLHANLFLVAVDEQRQWHRWHQMFAELMRSRLRAQSREQEATLHRRAAAWFASNGLPTDAIRHAAAAADWETVGRVVGGSWLDLVLSGEMSALASMLDLVPESVRAEDPEISAAAAMVALSHDDPTAAVRLSTRARGLSSRLPHERRLATECQALMLQLHLATLRGRDEFGDVRPAAVALLDELDDPALPATRRNRVLRGLLAYTLGAYETCILEFDDGARHLRAALADANATGLLHIQLSCYAQFVSHDFRNGRLERARQRAFEVIETAEGRGWAGYHNLATAYDNLAGLEILRDNLDAAMQHLAVAEDLVRPTDLVDLFHITFLKGLVLRAMGRVTDARTALGRLRALTDGWHYPDWVPVSIATAECDQLDAEGRTQEALDVLAPLDHHASASVTRPLGVVYASLLVRTGRAEEARRVLAGWTDPERGRPVEVAALVTDAAAAEALGLHDVALDDVSRALDAAHEDLLLRPLLAAGQSIAPLVKQRLDLGTAHESLAVELLNRLTPATRSASERLPYFVEPLSERELDVLRHLQSTLPNTEIATRLFVSVNTVKTHIKSINRKLGTGGRRDAVRRARELGLL